MSVLNHVAQFAAMILLIELIVVILVFAGVAGGLAFGLHWLVGKVDWASGKANDLLARGTHYIDIGLNYAALPVIKVAGFAETVKGTAGAIRRRVRLLALQRETTVTPAISPPPAPEIAPPPIAATPVQRPIDDTVVEPLPRPS